MAERRSYSSKKFQLDLPNLIQTQIDSYLNFLQKSLTPGKREKMGLQQIFSDIFPITDIKEMYSLEFENYSFGVPKYSLRECRERGLSYSLPLKATLSLYVYEGEREDKKFKEKITNDYEMVNLTKEEKEWLKKHKTLKIGIDPNWYPFEFFDEHNQHKGILADYKKIIEFKQFVIVKSFFYF